MALTKLDDITALVVIDLQKGIVAMPTAPYLAVEVIDRAARLAHAFREHGLPVVLVNVAGRAPGRTDAGPSRSAPPADWAELVPELERQLGDHLVTKRRVGAFLGTGLDDYLRRSGVTQVVLTGVATGSGVESTARNAYDLGYNVTLVVDAMADREVDTHRHSVEKVFPRLGETTTTDELLKLLRSGD
ncbi:MAG: isochorismatase family protein [Treponema sp.]|nr:isochorismatase family protein [Treponema sp.]